MLARLLQWLRSLFGREQALPAPPSDAGPSAGSGGGAGGGALPQEESGDTPTTPETGPGDPPPSVAEPGSGIPYAAPILRSDLGAGWRDPYSGQSNRPPVVASGYGRRHQTRDRRWAVDLGVVVGTPVYACAAGVVSLATDATDPNNGIGVWVTPDEGPAVRVIDIHLSERLVSVGDRVRRGQQIGLSGNTGASDGPHIHHEIEWAEGGGELDPMDPELFDWRAAGWGPL
jgi:murein DD-endopeptidase MepM/ murein hydrolase activator NlpD